jgi:hypothetical protein
VIHSTTATVVAPKQELDCVVSAVKSSSTLRHAMHTADALVFVRCLMQCVKTIYLAVHYCAMLTYV